MGFREFDTLHNSRITKLLGKLLKLEVHHMSKIKKIVANEYSALLSESEESLSSTSQEGQHGLVSPVTTTIKEELWSLVKNSFPIFVTFSCQFFVLNLFPNYFASKLGSKQFSAIALAITTFYCSGPCVIYGFSTAMDTLCATAYGAGNFVNVGLHYQKCTLILWVMMIPISIFWYNSKLFLAHISDDEELVFYCSQYLKMMPIAAPAFVLFECSKRFLQSQNKFDAPTRVILLSVPISLILNIIFLSHFGFYGPPTAFITTFWIMACSLVLYIAFIDGYQCWNSNFTVKELFQNWSQYLSLGFPGILMILSEAFAFQVLTFLSTKFGVGQLAVQSIVSSLASFSFQLPFSVGIYSSTRIANLIGARSSNYKVAYHAMLLACLGLAVLNFSWMSIFRFKLAGKFSQDEVIIRETGKVFLLVAFNQFIDCFNVISASIMRGQGRQLLGGVLSVVSYYIIATPFEIFFGFYLDMKVLGLWLGLIVGVFSLSVAELWFVFNSDWTAIMERSLSIA